MLSLPGRLVGVVAALTAAAATVGLGSPVGAAGSTDEAPRGTTAARTGDRTGARTGSGVTVAAGTSSTPMTASGVVPAGRVTQSLTDRLPGARPNIVVIMTDDMRWDELQFMPNVERFIEDRGVNFVNSFSPYPLCCPARASFVTGQYTQNHGVWSNGVRYGFGALDDTTTVATDLAAAGYQTAFLGKYLNGYGYAPPRDGSAEDSYRYVPPGWQDWRGSVDKLFGVGTPEEGGTYSYFDTTLNVNGTLVGNGGRYQTRVFGEQTEDMLQGLATSPRPFFLWVSYVAPHAGGPVEPEDPTVVRGDGRRAVQISPARPRDVKGMFDDRIRRSLGAVPEKDLSDKPSFMRDRPTLNASEVAGLTEVSRQRAEALYVVDQQVRRTVEVLKRTGELQNTVLVFTSDNGYMLGEHGRLQAKRLPYESSLRVPTLVAGPGIPRGERRRDPFITEDFAPTLLHVAGVRSTRTMDGTSMLDVARHGDRGWTRPVFTEAGRRGMPDGGRPPIDIYPEGPSSLRFSQGIRTARYLYVEHATGERELYDLRTDPLELESIVDEPAMSGVVRELAGVLDRMRMCRGESCRAPLPPDLQARQGARATRASPAPGLP